MTALAFLLRYWRIIAAVVSVVGLLGGAGLYIAKVKHDAYAAGYAAAQQQCERDKRAMEAANQKAADEAAKKLADATRQLELKDLQLDDYLKAIDLAADDAPDATTTCLSEAAVKRLSRIE